MAVHEAVYVLANPSTSTFEIQAHTGLNFKLCLLNKHASTLIPSPAHVCWQLKKQTNLRHPFHQL